MSSTSLEDQIDEPRVATSPHKDRRDRRYAVQKLARVARRSGPPDERKDLYSSLPSSTAAETSPVLLPTTPSGFQGGLVTPMRMLLSSRR
jgi:hypothetical protein